MKQCVGFIFPRGGCLPPRVLCMCVFCVVLLTLLVKMRLEMSPADSCSNLSTPASQTWESEPHVGSLGMQVISHTERVLTQKIALGVRAQVMKAEI